MRRLFVFSALALGLAAACSSFTGDAAPDSVAAEAGTADSSVPPVNDAAPEAQADAGPMLANVVDFKGSGPSYTIHISPSPNAGDILILAVAGAQTVNAAPPDASAGAAFTSTTGSKKNGALTIFQRVADGTETEVSGLVPDTGPILALLTAWRGVETVANVVPNSGGSVGDSTLVTISPKKPSFVVGFVAANAPLSGQAPDNGFASIVGPTGDLFDNSRALFAGYAFETGSGPYAPHWTYGQASASDEVTFALPAK